MKNRLLIAAFVVLTCLAIWRPMWAQNGVPLARGSTLPTTSCDLGQIFLLYQTDGSHPAGLYFCSNTAGTWMQVPWTTAVVPAGAIIFISSGTCPTGYAEVAALNGKMWRGTVAANGDVGTTGGSDSVTPAFTGSAWAAPSIAWPAGVPTFSGNSVTSSAVSAGTPAGTNGATATSGNCAATNIAAGTGSLTACKATAPNLTVTAPTFTGSALGTHTHTTTATGTVAWPAGVPTIGAYTPAGTIGAIDNRSAYINLIGCSKT